MALAEIAEFILNVVQLIVYLFKISIFIGKLLVELIARVSFIVWRILQVLGHFMVILYEDYSYFIEDFKSGLSSIAIFCIECLSSIGTGTINLVCSTGCGITAGIKDIFSGRFLTVPLFTVSFFKHILLLIGDGVWFLVTLPVLLVQNLWMYSVAVFNIVEHFLKHTGLKSMEATYRLSSYMILNMPLQSVAGIVILLLACKYTACTMKIARFCFKILQFIFRKLQPLGRTICRKICHYNERIAQCIQNATETFLVGFVCIQERAAHVYDAEVRRTVIFIRNFFAFSHHRRLPLARPHLSREGARQYHSSSEASSRSSSTSSDQSSEDSRFYPQPAQNCLTKRHLRETPCIGFCIICEDNEKSVVLVPCGHLCLCKRCADRLDDYDRCCPICRKLITRKVDVYI